MSEEQSKSLDLLGIRPIAKSIELATQGFVTGTGAILSRICYPAAEELGLLFQDKVRAWRGGNGRQIVQDANTILLATPGRERDHAHPRIVHRILEEGSWSDNPDIRAMWAGLLAASCNQAGDERDNLLFTDMLARLTPSQARLINYASVRCRKFIARGTGLIMCEEFHDSPARLVEISGNKNVQGLDIDMDRLRDTGLFNATSGLDPDIPHARFGVTAFCLTLYVRAQGFNGSPVDYFDIQERSQPPQQPIITPEPSLTDVGWPPTPPHGNL